MTSTNLQHDLAPQSLSTPRILLHIEGFAVMVVTFMLYAQYGGSWLLFGLLLFVPDVSMIGYLINSRVGSWLYNAVHSYTTPLIVGMLAFWLGATLGITVAIIWLFHIGMDRALGYGLKYPDAFKHTHLNAV